MLNASNAILAKARAKYGQRLTGRDYQNLTACKDVRDIVVYLRSRTRYGEALVKINEFDAHRGQIEAMLRQHLFYEFDSLCRYEMSLGSGVSAYVVRKIEIIQLTHFLILLSSGKTNEYIFSMPEYFNSHTDIYLDELIRARSYSGLLNAVRKSPYEKILREFEPKQGEAINLPAIEDRLYTYLYSELYKSIARCSSKSDIAELKKLCDALVDYENFGRIFRLDNLYAMTPEQILPHILPFGTITKKQVEFLCATEGSQEFLKAASGLNAGKLIKKLQYDSIGEVVLRAKYAVARNKMFFSNNPAAVLLSYISIAELELSNIINIIEGVRYGLPQDSINKLLIYSDD